VLWAIGDWRWAFRIEWINVGVIYRRENKHENDNKNDNENENDRIRKRAQSNGYNDVTDIMEREYSFCRGWPRCEITDCITFYVVYIKFTDCFDCLDCSDCFDCLF
jgi:hypothetical protein